MDEFDEFDFEEELRWAGLEDYIDVVRASLCLPRCPRSHYQMPTELHRRDFSNSGILCLSRAIA